MRRERHAVLRGTRGRGRRRPAVLWRLRATTFCWRRPLSLLAGYWLAVGIERDGNHPPSGALEACDRAPGIGPDFDEALNRGFDPVLLARYGEAGDAFARVLRLGPDDPFAMKPRALALHETGRAS